jgi:hypothetical protein
MFRHRWVRRTSLGLAVLFVLVVAGFFALRYNMHRTGVQRRDAITAHLDATDPGWRLDELDLARGQLPDDENSTLLIPQFKTALGGRRTYASRPNNLSLYDGVPPNHQLDDEGADVLDRTLDGLGPALSVAHEFRDRPRGVRHYNFTPDIIGTLAPDLQETRSVVTALDLEAEWLSRDGRPGAALQLVPVMLNAGRSIDREPFLIAALVRMAIGNIAARRVERVLALGEPRGRLAEVQAALFAEAESNVYWDGLRGERAAMDRLYTNLQNGVLPPEFLVALTDGFGGPVPKPSTATRARAWAHQPYVPGDHAAFLDKVTRALEVRHLPDHQQRAALKEIDASNDRTLPKKRQTRIASLLLPSVTRIHESSLRQRAWLRCAAVAIACERFRQLNGRWPDGLDEIPSDILAAVPLDPFDGKPLRYLRREDGVTIYSVGPDETDDGGNIPERSASQREPGYDIGCRVYDVPHRGLPPVPRFDPLPDFDLELGEPSWSPFRTVIPPERPVTPLPEPREVGEGM